ncbi:hypothetical protein Q5752_004982 [Cryptotrichosporon argae]
MAAPNDDADGLFIPEFGSLPALAPLPVPDDEVELEALRLAINNAEHGSDDDVHVGGAHGHGHGHGEHGGHSDGAHGGVQHSDKIGYADDAHDGHAGVDADADVNADMHGLDAHAHAHAGTGAQTPELPAPTYLSSAQVQGQSLEKAVGALQQLSAASQTMLDNMNLGEVLAGIATSFKVLVDSQRRQTEIVKNLVDSVQGRGPPTIDPSLGHSYIPRSEYDALKARYDSLQTSVAISTMSSGRRPRPSTRLTINDEAEGSPLGDDTKVRKRRSIKLEHLVHKMANRRLGVAYSVANFETPGSSDLPEPYSTAPTASSSLVGVDEFRPDFKQDVLGDSVAPFLAAVIDDVKAEWEATYAAVEPDVVDDENIQRAVHTYWTRLAKRWDEQTARERGEVHRDELTRRKQNQYRRQQSLVARRQAAFDQSPLNVCRLRALYRTLLTIDFASPTNERPDPARAYTEDEWMAYRKSQLGSRADAHEIVDLFWLSPTVRSLLAVLDTFATDQAGRVRRKGRPKQPAPAFHLPPELWDENTLPTLRPKDPHGLPLYGAPGVVLFRFHVDEKVAARFPEWAAGLYDNPPVSDEDALLPGLTDVMASSAYAHLKPRVRHALAAATVRKMDADEVEAVLAAPDDLVGTVTPIAGATGSGGGALPPALDEPDLDFMSTRGLENFVNLVHGGPLLQPFGPGAGMGVGVGVGALSPAGPSNPFAPTTGASAAAASPGERGAGSSLRARKQAKRLASEVPGGAAMPVPKRRRDRADANDDIDLSGDASFLESL